MAYQEMVLAQAAVSRNEYGDIYVPGAGITGIIKTIFLSNIDDAAATIEIIVDKDGDGIEGQKHSIYHAEIAADAYVQLNIFIPLLNDDGGMLKAKVTASTAADDVPGVGGSFTNANPDTIIGAASGFSDFLSGAVVEVTGSTSNNGTYQVVTVHTNANEILILDAGESLTAESMLAGTKIWELPIIMTVCGVEIS